jgi:hypothetical protein
LKQAQYLARAWEKGKAIFAKIARGADGPIVSFA